MINFRLVHWKVLFYRTNRTQQNQIREKYITFDLPTSLMFDSICSQFAERFAAVKGEWPRVEGVGSKPGLHAALFSDCPEISLKIEDRMWWNWTETVLQQTTFVLVWTLFLEHNWIFSYCVDVEAICGCSFKTTFS